MTTDYEPYPAPLDRLNELDVDESDFLATIDYRAFGIGEKDVPALIRIATDPGFDTALLPAAWAPLHACRALGMLRAAEATEPLLALLDRAAHDDWLVEEVPRALGEIGALTAVTEYLAQATHPMAARVAASNAVSRIGINHPDRRASCVSTLTSQLRLFEHQDRDLNAFLICDLLDLNAVESAPLMEEVFRADRVDLSINGDWEDVQVELGLLPARLTPTRRPALLSAYVKPEPGPPTSRTSRDRQAEKRRRKLAKQSKRRNRRRK